MMQVPLLFRSPTQMNANNPDISPISPLCKGVAEIGMLVRFKKSPQVDGDNRTRQETRHDRTRGGTEDLDGSRQSASENGKKRRPKQEPTTSERHRSVCLKL
mmetsp:Transcript_7034/g.19094  ORF Transcript_7034/g.19094 Transcript_7034/m.19094 type:complete len:102 (-) Transcript_7034:50-355(-)